MLSIGIQFGQGFDQGTILKMSQTIPKEYDYDFIVIGSNPGGVACAREAMSAGKKTAIVTWKSYTPAEAEGFDEDLTEMAMALNASDDNLTGNEKQKSALDTSTESSHIKSKSTLTFTNRHGAISAKTNRKTRPSRLDLSNELFKRGKQCRKLMHNAVRLGDLVEDAHNSGWRISTIKPPLTVNWNKMSEEVMDYVMKENWTLAAELAEEGVEVIEGCPKFEDNHTVKVIRPDMSEVEYTTEFLCMALPTECILPPEVSGAQKFGINCDDFIRMSEPPGKTLVVGSLLESIECAGIIASAKFPVTVVSRSKILKGYDSEISQMIIDELRNKGVVFKELNLISVERAPEKKLQATFISVPGEEETEVPQEKTQETFDTVLFAVGRTFDATNYSTLGFEIDANNQKIRVNRNEQTTVENIYAVGDCLADCPEDFEVSLLAGKFLGKRLFQGGTDFMNYTMIPTVMYTPTEYAFVGMSEDAALYRLGMTCVDVYFGYFKPLDFVVPSKKGECYAKVIVLKPTEEIIGLHMYGPEAGEIIQGFAAAIRNGLTLTNFRTIVGITATKAQEILKVKELRTMEKLEAEVPLFE